MRRFVNFFLILFFTDGIISFLNVTFGVYPDTALLSLISCISSWAVIAVAIPLYVCLGIDRRLNKAIFLPQLIFVFWSLFQFWPLPVMLDRARYGLPMAVSQILLCVVPLLHFRIIKPAIKYNKQIIKKHTAGKDLTGQVSDLNNYRDNKTKKRILLPPEMFYTSFFKLKHTVLFFVIHLALLPLILIYMAVAIASLHLDEKTGGYVRLRPDGLRMMERIYRRDNKEIRLAGMIHIADKAYFDAVIESIPSQGTIVLAEGISDRYHQLAAGFRYGGLAQNLGLTSQENMTFQGKLIEADDIPLSASTAENEAYHILRADIDIADFNPKTIEFIKVIGSTLLSDTSISKGMRTYLAWVRENSPHVTPQIIMDDLLYRRDQEVITHMESMLAHYDTIVIPWGALHMPEIEAAVLQRGFLLSNTRERIGIDFIKMLFARLFN
jgi:hypothetical protein